MDIARIPYVIKASRKCADGPVTIIRKLVTPNDRLAARLECTDENGVLDVERFALRYPARCLRGWRGLVDDGKVIEFCDPLDIDAKEALLREHFPATWLVEVLRVLDSDSDVSQEEERGGSATAPV